MVNIAELDPDWVKHIQDVISKTTSWEDFVAQIMIEEQIVQSKGFVGLSAMIFGEKIPAQERMIDAIIQDFHSVSMPYMQQLYQEVHPDSDTHVEIAKITPVFLQKLDAFLDLTHDERQALYLKLQRGNQ